MKVFLAACMAQAVALPVLDVASLVPRSSDMKEKMDERREKWKAKAEENRWLKWKKFDEYQTWQRQQWQQWQEDQKAKKDVADAAAQAKEEKGKASFEAKAEADIAQKAADEAKEKADAAAAAWKAAADKANTIHVKASQHGAEKPAWDSKHKAGKEWTEANAALKEANEAADAAQEKAEAAEAEWTSMAKKAEFAASKIYDPAKHQKEEEEKAQENAPEEKTKANGDTRPVGGRHQRQDKEDDAPSTSVAPAL